MNSNPHTLLLLCKPVSWDLGFFSSFPNCSNWSPFPKHSTKVADPGDSIACLCMWKVRGQHLLPLFRCCPPDWLPTEPWGGSRLCVPRAGITSLQITEPPRGSGSRTRILMHAGQALDLLSCTSNISICSRGYLLTTGLFPNTARAWGV